MQPNAPGTQGYNRYSYTANNPATWTDPSGHSVGGSTGGGTLPNWVDTVHEFVGNVLVGFLNAVATIINGLAPLDPCEQ